MDDGLYMTILFYPRSPFEFVDAMVTVAMGQSNLFSLSDVIIARRVQALDRMFANYPRTSWGPILLSYYPISYDMGRETSARAIATPLRSI